MPHAFQLRRRAREIGVAGKQRMREDRREMFERDRGAKPIEPRELAAEIEPLLEIEVDRAEIIALECHAVVEEEMLAAVDRFLGR